MLIIEIMNKVAAVWYRMVPYGTKKQNQNFKKKKKKKNCIDLILKPTIRSYTRLLIHYLPYGRFYRMVKYYFINYSHYYFGIFHMVSIDLLVAFASAQLRLKVGRVLFAMLLVRGYLS